jgi:hypothetical protein
MAVTYGPGGAPPSRRREAMVEFTYRDGPLLLSAVDAALAFADFLDTEPKSPAPIGGWAAARHYYARRLRGELTRALLGEGRPNA